MIRTKFREVSISVLPVALLILIFNLIFSEFNVSIFFQFIIGSVFVIIGLTLFLLGVETSIIPFGRLTGPALAKTNRIWIVLISALVLGFIISIAEPGLMVLAKQIQFVSDGDIQSIQILVVVSIGLAVMLAVGFLRIIYQVSLHKMLLVLYIIILVLLLFSSEAFIGISFDASGSTTGILAVPFILALSSGISKLKKDTKQSENDSFGLVAIASTGAVIAVLLLDIVSKGSDFSRPIEIQTTSLNGIVSPFINQFPLAFFDSFLAILPLLVIFFLLQLILFKLDYQLIKRFAFGFAYAFLGLMLFLLGVKAGFMEIGFELGSDLANGYTGFVIALIGFILGFVTILAEPAVHVLTHQIEEVTSGYVKRLAVLIPLASGVGISVMLSVIRVLVSDIQLWHYLLPGYLLIFILVRYIPKLFVGIAFDAGGVATGPITTTFILAFIHGIAYSTEQASVLIDGFGMIAMVSMTPILTLEILGLVFHLKAKRREREATKNDG